MRWTSLLLLLAIACGDDDTNATADLGVDAAEDPSVSADAGVDAPSEEDAGMTMDAGIELALPQLPELSGECPDFSAESFTFGGLEINVLAGEVQDTPGPLLFNWHGTGGNGRFAIRRMPTSVREAITSQGGMILAPNDDGAEREGFSPNGVWYETSDLELADQLAACAVRDRNIDPARIHVTGCSAGGIMGAVMTTTRSAYVASAFLDSGGLLFVPAASSDYSPAVLTMHGGPADVVIVSFQTLSERLVDLTANRGGVAIDCNHLSGHCGAPNDLREAGWAFVDAHRYGAGPAFPDALPDSFPSYCVAQ